MDESRKEIFRKRVGTRGPGIGMVFMMLLSSMIAVAAGVSPAWGSNPEKAWITFLGGAGEDHVLWQSVDIDRNGNLCVAGFSAASWGSPIQAYTGGTEAFVAKLDMEGHLLWNTFLGSADEDIARAVTWDRQGNIYVLGRSDATWGAPVAPYNGPRDSFVAKLAPDGRLLWNTFLAPNSGGREIVASRDGGVLVTGECPSTWGAPIRAFSVASEGYVAKLDADGNLLWNTFLGGNDMDMAMALAEDPEGNLYVAGGSMGTWGSPNQAHTGTGNYDGCLAKLDADGRLIWNAFYGSAAYDIFNGIEVDRAGNLILVGEGAGNWGNPIQEYSGGDNEVFASKVDRNGNLIWNTFMGTFRNDRIPSVAVDGNGHAYVTGYSEVSWGEPWNSFSGGKEAFAAKLDSSGNRLWNAFLGSALEDLAYAVAADGNGNIGVVGTSDAAWGGPVRAYTGDVDVFVALISEPQTEASESHTLSIQNAGEGEGTVTSSPVGIACGDNRVAVFKSGTTVTLTAVPDPGSAFDGWSGAGQAGNGQCEFWLSGDKTVTATFNPDTDGDGISDVTEAAGPYGGDGNRDGFPDAEQKNVVSFEDLSGSRCTLVSETGTELSIVRAQRNPSPFDSPTDREFRSGFFGFILTGLNPGQATIVNLIVHREMSGDVDYYKYGPTEENRVNHWYSFHWDGQTGARVVEDGGRTVIDLYFVDGARGDDDLIANGEIEDVGGPAEPGRGEVFADSSGGCFISTLCR